MNTKQVTKTPAKRRGPGRPKARINWRRFAQLCKPGTLSAVDMAGALGVHVDTLRDRAFKRFGVPLREVMDAGVSAGKAEREDAAQRLAATIGPGSNSARDYFRPRTARGGSQNNIQINIGDPRGRRVANSIASVTMISHADIADILPDDVILRDEETGQLRRATPEELELLPEDVEIVRGLLPVNGFELEATQEERDARTRAAQWTAEDQRRLDARLAAERAESSAD